MTTLAIKTFDGMYPVISPRLLRDDAALVARNARITGGSLRTWGQPVSVWDQRRGSEVRTIYLFDGDNWFEWTTDVNVVRGPIAADTLERTYYTGDGHPKMTTTALAPHATSALPAASYILGVPPPVDAMSVSVSGTAGAGVPETRFYVYTYVSALGEEGPPSQATEVVVGTGQTVHLTGMNTGPTGNYNFDTKRIYRTATGSTAADFQFVAEVALATTSYDDTKTGVQLGEVMVSADWYPPRSTVHNEPGSYNSLVVSPSPYTLGGITLMANSIMVGFAHNIVCFSEPSQPHAWPRRYELTTDKPIVGIGAFGQALAVLTESYPYLVTGVDPAAMTMERLPIMQSCVSKRSIVEMGDGVIYASPDGLVSIGAGGIQMITKNLFGHAEWQAFVPESIHAYQYDGRYFAFYDTGDEQGCMVFSFTGTEPSFTLLDIYATAGHVDAVDDALYLMIDNEICEFDAGTPMTHTWRSKRFTLPAPMNFAAAQVIAADYPLTLTVSGADGAYSYTIEITNTGAVRLPATMLYRDVELQVSGAVEVEQIMIASSMQELRAL